MEAFALVPHRHCAGLGLGGVSYVRKRVRIALALQAKLQQEFASLRQEKKVIYDFHP